MNGLHRKGGTMLTADEVAGACGGISAPAIAPGTASDEHAEERDYPQNPAGPVDTRAAGTQFNRR